jgi:hypothetical protein
VWEILAIENQLQYSSGVKIWALKQSISVQLSPPRMKVQSAAFFSRGWFELDGTFFLKT